MESPSDENLNFFLSDFFKHFFKLLFILLDEFSYFLNPSPFFFYALG